MHNTVMKSMYLMILVDEDYIKFTNNRKFYRDVAGSLTSCAAPSAVLVEKRKRG